MYANDILGWAKISDEWLALIAQFFPAPVFFIHTSQAGMHWKEYTRKETSWFRACGTQGLVRKIPREEGSA
jgi:tRNA A37 threonylcarbamoyladenosine synthetase subunit TsaC/SUA5/YrdC